MSEFLNALTDFIKEKNINIYRVTEIAEGKCETAIILPTNRCQNIYSVSKVFTLTALGIMYDKGLVKLSDKVTDFFPEYEPKDEKWEKVTVENLITHKCGLEVAYLDIDSGDCYSFDGEKDYLKFLFETKLVCEPGTERRYNDAGYYILARIVEKLSNEPFDILMNREFFTPIKCSEFAFTHTPLNHTMGATGLYIDTETMARMGQLYMDGGVVCGKRILSEKWVNIILDNEFELAKICSGKARGKGGMYGQYLMFIPFEKRVLAWEGYHRQNDIIHEFIEKNIKSSL